MSDHNHCICPTNNRTSDKILLLVLEKVIKEFFYAGLFVHKMCEEGRWYKEEYVNKFYSTKNDFCQLGETPSTIYLFYAIRFVTVFCIHARITVW